jgi:hypothetical protein
MTGRNVFVLPPVYADAYAALSGHQGKISVSLTAEGFNLHSTFPSRQEAVR